MLIFFIFEYNEGHLIDMKRTAANQQMWKLVTRDVPNVALKKPACIRKQMRKY